MKNTALIAAAGFGLIGVALGAFGAHALEKILTTNGRVETWHTAVLYQFVHVYFLLGIGVLGERGLASKWLRAATIAAIAGIVIFSGSLYLLSFTNIPWLGAITPLGGLSFIVAWAMLLVYGLQRTRSL